MIKRLIYLGILLCATVGYAGEAKLSNTLLSIDGAHSLKGIIKVNGRISKYKGCEDIEVRGDQLCLGGKCFSLKWDNHQLNKFDMAKTKVSKRLSITKVSKYKSKKKITNKKQLQLDVESIELTMKGIELLSVKIGSDNFDVLSENFSMRKLNSGTDIHCSH